MRRFFVAALWALGASATLHAWPADMAEALNRDARRLLPRTLAQLLAERQSRIIEASARLPLPVTRALAAARTSGRIDDDIAAVLNGELDRAVRLLKEQQVEEGLVALGALGRIGAEVSDPILTAPEGYQSAVVAEYYAFVRSKMATMPVVLDDKDILQGDRAALRAYWQKVLERGRAQSGVVRDEFVKNGRIVSFKTVDARSPAFGVAQLAYSRAINAMAATWLVAWREAKGDQTRRAAVPIVRPTNVPKPPQSPSPTPGTERP